MKVLITGGHPATAFSLIESLQKNKKIEITFVGTKYFSEKNQTLSFEYKQAKKRKIRFVNLPAGKFKRDISFFSPTNLKKLIISLFYSYKILNREKPDLILSFGSYLAVPLCFVAYLKKIPIYTHEQTITIGVANKIISKFATKIFVSFPQTLKYLPKEKALYTGNPIRPSVFKIIDKPFEINTDRKIIYVTGGSLGSHSINQHIKNILPSLLKEFTIIHQTGDVKRYNDYEKLLEFRSSLLPNLKENYFLKPHFLDDGIGYIYHKTEMVISRAGANTFFELIALKKPAILIPLPWSAKQEQLKHAKILKEKGVGEIFEQKEDSQKLLALIKKMAYNLNTYKKNFAKFNIPLNANKKIIKEILALDKD